MEFQKKHEQMLERIYNEVVGDEFTEGIIPQVKKNTEKIKQHDFYFRVVIAVFLVLSFLFVFFENIKCFAK
jgi:hypothetical protein